MKNNIEFSPLIIGTMRLGEWGVKMTTEELERYVDQCLDLGLNDFDHADIYGHYTEESRFGKLIRRRPDLKNKIQITTKCGIKLISDNRPSHKIKSYDSTKEHILWSADNSLKELGVESIDLLLIHRPDYLMDPHDIAEAFSSLKESGKVQHFGVSNFTTSQFDLLNSAIPICTNQIEASIVHTDPFEDGILDQCMKNGIHPTIWSPLGGGAMFNDQPSDQIKRIHQVAKGIGKKFDLELDQVLLAWLAKHPSKMIPVLGTTKISRIKKALHAVKVKITHEEWYELWEASKGEEVA